MTALRIVADSNLPGVETVFSPWGEVRRVEGRTLQREQLLEADVLLVRSVTRVDRALLEGTPVRFVGSGTAGLDHVDREFLQARGIGFAAAPGANANAVVEYVLAVIGAVDDFAERLLNGGRVGIVGCGHVGHTLAARLDALGIANCQYDPWLAEEGLPTPGSLAEVLACDVISLHCELTRQAPWPSYHLLDAACLAALTPQQLLINASRGAVVDNRALAARLRAAEAPRAVLDVWEAEPRVDAALLERLALGTPHIAGYSLDAKWAATRLLADALAEFLGRAGAMAGALPSPEAIELPGHLAGAGLWRALLGSRYDPREDDRALRALVSTAEPAQVPSGFDALRRHYRERRELAGSRVHVATEHQREFAQALGCQVTLG